MAEKQSLTTIGRVERIEIPKWGIKNIPARIDTGAKTSAIWASSIRLKNDTLQFKLFGPESEYYTGQTLSFEEYDHRVIASSNGSAEARYIVRFLIKLGGRNIQASFSLANREQQVYPVLIGRKVLTRKFIVDVSKGTPLIEKERRHSEALQKDLSEEK